MAYDSENDRLLLFGGRSVTGTLLADLWSFDLASSAWIDLTDPGGGPPARQAHTLTYDPVSGDTILVGGVAAEGDTLLGDTWHYRNGWTQAVSILPPRAYHHMVYNSVTGSLILFSHREVWRYE
jgi:hypothetical protein